MHDHHHHWLIWLLEVLMLLTSEPLLSSSDLPDTLIIGKISHNPKKHYAYLKPMADYVLSNLKYPGIRKAKVRMAKTRQQMVQWMRAGYVDWVTETPFAAAHLVHSAGAIPLLKKWKKGAQQYHTIFFTHKDNAIHTLQDLQGKVLALEDPASTSSYYVPALLLSEQGLSMFKLNSFTEAVPQDKIGFVFAREEISISNMVYRKLAAAGAFNNQDWNKEDHLPKKLREQLRIIASSETYFRSMELVRKNMPDELQNEIRQILLNAKNSSAGRNAMRAYQRATGFASVEMEDIEKLSELFVRAQTIDAELRLAD